ncbi:NAD(P)H-dependent glycerol-3-phosphate dehydrogenase [Maritalea sp.]|uniref:NAD(P)H-dependent glycerol-3-phosphate dehydrogenase n=1 Tax=Maritalea sp. TaxID=2003361 RepID=UPI003EF19C3A
MTEAEQIFVVGAGAWGVALAHATALSGSDVCLCGRDQTVVDMINQHHTNPQYPAVAKVDNKVSAQVGYEGIAAAKTILVVVPAQATRQALLDIGVKNLAGKNLVLCAKGLEQGTLKRQSEIVREITPDAVAYALSGPSFAIDVAQSKPTAVTLAGPDIEQARAIVDVLAGPTFRPYSSDDLVGVELAGALKNIYALGAGAVEGAGLGFSARSSLIARGFAEMGRLVEALGGSPATLNGLAGLGDLTMSCTARESRNYEFGFRLGAGESVQEILDSGAKLAEGVFSAPVGFKLAQQNSVDVPIVGAVNALLVGKVTIDVLVANLMARPLRSE